MRSGTEQDAVRRGPYAEIYQLRSGTEQPAVGQSKTTNAPNEPPHQRFTLLGDILKQPLRPIHGTRLGLGQTNQRGSAKQNKKCGKIFKKTIGFLKRAFGDFSHGAKDTRGRQAPPGCLSPPRGRSPLAFLRFLWYSFYIIC